MAGDPKAGGGNLFVVSGESGNEIIEEGDLLRVRLPGVDIFRPATGEVTSPDPEDIACVFIDTGYNEQRFFVRDVYFLGAELPYGIMKTAFKTEIDQEAWESLKDTVSRRLGSPRSGRIAAKVIDHPGEEVMKVMEVRNGSPC